MAKRKNSKGKASLKNNSREKEPKIFGVSIYYIVIAISVLALIFSFLIMFEKKYYETGESNLCTIITNGNGCQTVQTSPYASIMGIKNPWYGVVGFSLLIISALLAKFKRKDIFENAVILAGFIAGPLVLWFLYVQTFLLSTYCILCLCVDILSLMLLGISIWLLSRKIKSKKA